MAQQTPASRTPSLTFGKRLLFSSILLLLVLGTLELIAQVYLRTARGYAGGSFLQYEFDPYKNIHPVPNWEDKRGVRHNAQGFRRSEDVTREKGPNTFRVFLMGASTAYGTGGLWPHIQRDFEVLRNDETIDAYLERLIERELPGMDVEVVNAAIPSVWTHHHLIYLNQTILGFDPDLVVFIDGLNDHFYYNPDHDQFGAYVYTEQSRVIMGPATLGSLVRMNGWWLFRTSAFAHVAIRAAQGLARTLSPPSPLPEIDVEGALVRQEEVFRANALAMIRRNALLLRHEGIPALFALQPMLVLERERLPRMPEIERRMFEFNLESTAPRYEEYIVSATPRVAAMIEETVEPLGGRFVDLTGIYSQAGEEQIFTDYAHLTPVGNRMLAEALLPALLPMLPGIEVERAGEPSGQ